MASKFEKLIEYVVANDEKKARRLFHSIVVDKSRKIYEDLDLDGDTSRNFDEVESDETSHELDEFGGDEQDDLKSDVLVDSDLEDEELTPEVDDRLSDLENEFDALKAEFDELQVDGDVESEDASLDTEAEDLDDTEDLDDDFEDEDEFSDETETETETESDDDETETETESEDEEDDLDDEEPVDESVIREYVEKVTKGLANSTEEPSTQKKSPVAGKNEIVKGISAKNIAQGGSPEKGRPTPTSGKFTPDVVNVPGGKARLKPGPSVKKTGDSEGTNKKSVL